MPLLPRKSLQDEPPMPVESDNLQDDQDDHDEEVAKMTPEEISAAIKAAFSDEEPR